MYFLSFSQMLFVLSIVTVQTVLGDFDVHYQLGNEYNKRGMVDDAIREYKKAIEINDRAPKLYNNLGVAYGKKKVVRR